MSRRSRRALAALVLVFLTASAGCTAIFGPGDVDESALAEDPHPDYEWDSDADAYLHLNNNNYTAVYDISNRTEGDFSDDDPTLEVYQRDPLGREDPVELSALQFRHPNGTLYRYEETDDGPQVVRIGPDGSSEPAPGALTVNNTRTRAVVHLPANESGKLAFTAPRNGKSLSTPTVVEGRYEMVLPGRAEVGIPILAQIRPGASETTVDARDRVHIHWENVQSRNLAVRYYLDRDLWIFSGLVGILSVVGVIGSAYYLLEIRKTKRKREEVGLDIDVPDDDDRGPPPGMR